MNKVTLSAIALIVLLVLGYSLYALYRQRQPETETQPSLGEVSSSPNEASPSGEAVQGATALAPTELLIEDLKIGTGEATESGDTITVHYAGTLLTGEKFDSSYDRGQPFTTEIGMGKVIPGWDQGLLGMKVGGKRRLTIPAALAYGSLSRPGIPANSALVFEVELLGVTKP